jgi:hypothetical protein
LRREPLTHHRTWQHRAALSRKGTDPTPRCKKYCRNIK